MVPVTTFSMDTSNAPASIYPATDMLTYASDGSVGVIPSYISGVSIHIVTVCDVAVAPDHSVSVVGTFTSIWGFVAVLGYTTPGTGLAISIGSIAPCLAAPCPPRVPSLPLRSTS
jgi:hypothetical protein